MSDTDRLALALRDAMHAYYQSIDPRPGLTLLPVGMVPYLAARLVAAGVTLAPTPPDALPFAETQRFYNAGFAAGARAALDFAEASVLALPNEDRDGYEERWVKRSGVTGIIEIGRREYIAPTPPDAPTDEERAAFKRSELAAARALGTPRTGLGRYKAIADAVRQPNRGTPAERAALETDVMADFAELRAEANREALDVERLARALILSGLYIDPEPEAPDDLAATIAREY